MRGKINKTAISALKPGEVLRDTECKGFIVRMAESGVASYKIKCDLWQGTDGQRIKIRTITETIGTDVELTPERARTIARGRIARVQAGEDITRPGGASDAPESSTPAFWTVEKAYEEYCRTADERTAADMRYRLDRYLSSWRAKSIADITEHEVRARHLELQSIGAHTANRSLRDFRAVYNLFLRVFARSNPPLNPVLALDAKSWAKEAESHQEIDLNAPDAMRNWYVRLRKLSSTLRQEMHLQWKRL